MRKILFSRQSECIQPIRELVEKQMHRTLVMWAFDCGERLLEVFEERYADEKRPRLALETAMAWARGEIKMPVAKKAIHAAHNAATSVEDDPVACAAARAVGHATATVHVETHALGVVFYGLTAFVYAAGSENAKFTIEKECQWFYEKLLYWEKNIYQIDTSWAGFLLKDELPNKEWLLRKKTEREKQEIY